MMTGFERKTIAIVISDIHIGNESCRIEEFTIFLDNILQNLINGNLQFLRTLIILGDFLDLMATSFEDLCSNDLYFPIYDKLNDIKNQNIEIILALRREEKNDILMVKS